MYIKRVNYRLVLTNIFLSSIKFGCENRERNNKQYQHTTCTWCLASSCLHRVDENANHSTNHHFSVSFSENRTRFVRSSVSFYINLLTLNKTLWLKKRGYCCWYCSLSGHSPRQWRKATTLPRSSTTRLFPMPCNGWKRLRVTKLCSPTRTFSSIA